MNDRHYFQFGAVGGPSSEEYYQGSERTRTFLVEQKTEPSSWLPPKPNATVPEAEWGFESALLQDLQEFSFANRWLLKRVSFADPEDLRDLTADFYSCWSGEQKKTPFRLLVESLILLDPQWALQSRTVPYWTVFGIKSSLTRVLKYLGQMNEPPAFEELFALLFPNGVESVGLPSVSEWKKLGGFAHSSFRFIGLDEKAYPRDFGAFLRYHRELWRSIPLLDRPSDFVSLEALLRFIRNLGSHNEVTLQDDAKGNSTTSGVLR